VIKQLTYRGAQYVLVPPRSVVYNKVAYDLVTASAAEKEMERLFLQLLPGTEFAGKAYAVGGYVRDEVMGIDSKDLDIVVGFPNGAEELAKFIAKTFPGKTSTPRQMGSYPIWYIMFKDDVELGGKVYKTKGGELDLADSQKEAFPDPESRQRETSFGTVEEDVARRDFTVNMLLKDLTTGKLADFTGVSIHDIKHGILRGHPKVPLDQTFTDDPLRMLRLIRFMVKYGWRPDQSAVDAVKRNAYRIEIISHERVRDELIKIMLVGGLAKAIRFMESTGLLKYILPEVDSLRGIEQPKEYHAEGDVFEHTMHVLEHAKPTIHAQLAALLHDAGKPSTQEFIGDKIQFLGHEEVSGEIAEAFMRRLRFDNELIKRVRFLVENHMRPVTSDQWSPKAVRKFIRDVGEHLEDLLDLHDADSGGSLDETGRSFPSNTDILRKKIEEVQEIPVREKPVLDGREIMRVLNIPTGKEVGLAQRWLQEKVDDYAVEGKDLTPDEAKRLLREEYKRERS
jgi:poly(A) polymerase